MALDNFGDFDSPASIFRIADLSSPARAETEAGAGEPGREKITRKPSINGSSGMGKYSHNGGLQHTGKNSLAKWEQIPIIAPMEQLIAEVEAYCAAAGTSPQRVLRAAIGASWGQWDRWKAGTSSPTMIIADRLRQWMADHPPTMGREDAA